MIIYSPVPPDLIWFNEKQSEFRVLEENVNGLTVQVVVSADNARIERILSTDPQDYMNVCCQPGVVLESWKKR